MTHAGSGRDPRLASCDQDDADARDFAAFIAGQDALAVSAAAWMVRRQDGLSATEQAELDAWLATDPDHAEALAQLEGVWGRMDELPDEDVEALKAILPADRAAVAPAPRPGGSEVAGRRRWFMDLGRLIPLGATAAVIVGAGGGGWFGWSAWQARPSFTLAVATVRGEQKALRLPDGSDLWLDTATRAEIRLYRGRRELRLAEGQVLLAVQADPGRPFDVVTAATRVTVIGTRFSVRRTDSGLGEAGSVSVAVEEGRVRVATRQPSGIDEAVVLSAGQSVVADASGVLAQIGTDAASRVSWQEGRVNFNGASLAKALAEFERYADTGLVIRDPAVAALRVQGSFSLRQVGAFARALPQVLPVRLRSVAGRTEIVAAR